MKIQRKLGWFEYKNNSKNRYWKKFHSFQHIPHFSCKFEHFWKKIKYWNFLFCGGLHHIAHPSFIKMWSKLRGGGWACIFLIGNGPTFLWWIVLWWTTFLVGISGSHFWIMFAFSTIYFSIHISIKVMYGLVMERITALFQQPHPLWGCWIKNRNRSYFYLQPLSIKIYKYWK